MTISDSWQTTWLNQGVSLIEFVIMDTIASIDEFGCASHREWSGSSASANIAKDIPSLVGSTSARKHHCSRSRDHGLFYREVKAMADQKWRNNRN